MTRAHYVDGIAGIFQSVDRSVDPRVASSRSNAAARPRPQMRRLRPPERRQGARQSSIGRDLVEDSSARIDQADLQTEHGDTIDLRKGDSVLRAI